MVTSLSQMPLVVAYSISYADFWDTLASSLVSVAGNRMYLLAVQCVHSYS